MRSGYKTTEFWLTVAAAVVGFAMASGLFAEGSTTAQVFGFIGMVLSSLGYSYSRGIVKSK